MKMLRLFKRTALLAGSLSLLSWLTASSAQAFTLTVLHNNDGESQLTPDGDEAGAARFVTLINSLQNSATTDAVITLSSGDNFLAGTAFDASLDDGIFYDAIVLNAIGYDAIALGNHDFDFGPDLLAEFITSPQFTNPVPYLSANLDFSGEPALQALFELGPIDASALTNNVISESAIIDKGGEKIGVVSAITEELASISSPRGVEIEPVLAAVQAEIDQLEAQGINKIILISHLQSINNELDLVPQLSGVDIVIAGGGDELLADAAGTLLPSDQAQLDAFLNDTDGDPETNPNPVFGDYPIASAVSQNGQVVPVVTTPGNYQYIGRLEVEFNDQGVVTSFNGEPVRVLAQDPNTSPDPFVQANAVEPVLENEAELAQNVIGQTDVTLDGTRALVRTQQTNFGNLIADSLLWQGQQLADEFGVDSPQVGLQNGGGIRNDVVIPAGSDITELDTFTALPFPNFVSVIPDVGAALFKAVLENAVSQVEDVAGRYAQVAGFTLGLDLTAAPGSRVIDVTLDDGTPIVFNAQVVAGAPAVDVATIDFLARGGDDYPFTGLDFTSVGVSYQQALANYIQQELGGTVTAEAYLVDSDRVVATMFDPDESLSSGGDGGMDGDMDGGMDGGSDPASVPEPGTVLGLIATGAIAVLKRRTA
ncbi:MAG: PEP-CTERM sorting domain-containing protein [Leptolyngbya sp. SIO4C1]|nr:PEP-CTERM sorting domain-containing protein [Leptolyngbya sp. SIO4C1]